MSIFNSIVKPHLVAPILLRSIEWAQDDDTEKKYPLLGRIRYVWMDEDYKNVKILLKDGPTSWSDNKEEIESQIKRHESLVSYRVLERNTCYIIAEFRPLNINRDKSIDRMMENMRSIDEKILSENKFPYSLTKDPFDIFDEAMKNLESGKIEVPEEIVKVFEDIKRKLGQ